MKEQSITEQESIAIIQSMIAKTKEEMVDRSIFLNLWGIAVSLCAIVQYILLKMLFTNTQMVWLAMPIVAIIHIIIAIKFANKERHQSLNSFAINSLWIALGIAIGVIVFLSFYNSFNLFSFLILIYAIGTFVTGRIIQFKPLIIGGLICFGLSVLINFIDGAEQLLVLALSVVVSYLIPGFILRNEYHQQKNKV